MTVAITFECPRCGYKCDAATAVSDEPIEPKAGDLSVCLHCGAPLEFAEDLTPRWLTFDEFKTLPPDVRGPLLMVILGIVTLRPSGVVAVAWRNDGPE